jgi:hypothetical protein
VEWRYPIYTAGVDISKNCERPLLAELRSSGCALESLLWRNFLDMEGKILNLQILQRPSSINSPEQTLRMLSPAATTDPTETLVINHSGNPAANRFSFRRECALDLLDTPDPLATCRGLGAPISNSCRARLRAAVRMNSRYQRGPC